MNIAIPFRPKLLVAVKLYSANEVLPAPASGTRGLSPSAAINTLGGSGSSNNANGKPKT
jgi:hypothetical protein